MKKLVLFLGVFLSLNTIALADEKSIDITRKTEQIIETCQNNYPTDEVNDKFSKITLAQKNINQCIKKQIILKAKNIFSTDLYEQFIKKLDNFENAGDEIYSLIFLDNADISPSNELMENWIIEKRKTEMLRVILADIIYNEKWAD